MPKIVPKKTKITAASLHYMAELDDLAALVGNRSRIGQGDRRSHREIPRATFTHGGQIATNMQERKKKAKDAVKEQKKVVAKVKTEQKQKADDLGNSGMMLILIS